MGAPDSDSASLGSNPSSPATENAAFQPLSGRSTSQPNRTDSGQAPHKNRHSPPHPAIAAILATGRMEFETPTGWRAADLGLRGEVIEAAQRIRPAEKLHDTLLAGGRVVFKDDELDLVVRWSPG